VNDALIVQAEGIKDILKKNVSPQVDEKVRHSALKAAGKRIIASGSCWAHALRRQLR
jgi:hypothetical protein